jgi:transposase
VEKKLPRTLAAWFESGDVAGRKVRLMFQDEARFGRMVRIRRSWAPRPQRPMVCNGYEREFVYVYGAVSPLQGQLDWMITRKMNTENMSAFLAQVSAKHRRDFIVMVVDGASSHVAKDLIVPKNMRLLRLPPYAPELNPQEHIWDELREKAFPNRVFADLDSVLAQLQESLPRMAADRAALRSLTAWPWIVSLNLNAH